MSSGGTCIDNQGWAHAVTDDGQLVVVAGDGSSEQVEAMPASGPMFNLGCAPEGGLVAAAPAAERLVVVRRQDNAVWKAVPEVRLPRLQGGQANATTPIVWIGGAGPVRHLMVGTSQGFFEFDFGDFGIRDNGYGPYERGHEVEHLAVSRDGRLLAVSLGEHGVSSYCRSGERWQLVESIPFTLPVVHLAFARNDRLLLTTADAVEIRDEQLQLKGLIPRIDETAFVAAHGLPGGEKVVTVTASSLLREWWLDDAKVLAEATARR